MKQAIRKFRAKHLHFRFPSEDCECDIAGDGCGCFSDLYYYLGTCVNSEVILDNLFGEVGVDGHLVSFFIESHIFRTFIGTMPVDRSTFNRIL